MNTEKHEAETSVWTEYFTDLPPDCFTLAFTRLKFEHQKKNTRVSSDWNQRKDQKEFNNVPEARLWGRFTAAAAAESVETLRGNTAEGGGVAESW